MPKPKAKSKSTTVRFPGGSIHYSAGRDSASAKIAKALVKATLARQKREKANVIVEVATKRPHKLHLRPHLVAFIDILGFGREIENAKTESDLLRIHRKLHFVQKAFQNPRVADNRQHQALLNKEYGRQVIALSDAVVVAISPDCPAAPQMGIYDLFGQALWDLLLAQAECVRHGIFLRGGISHGLFFYDASKHILLSPALARAYELESSFAIHPVIVVPDSTLKAVLNAPKLGSYAPGAEPTPELVRKHEGTWRGQSLFSLDYVKEMMNAADVGWFPKDRALYEAARRKHNNARAQELLNRRGLKSAALYLRGHKQRLEEAYNSTTNEHVREKYRWLMRYHNQSIPRKFPHVRRQLIDMRGFRAPAHKAKI